MGGAPHRGIRHALTATMSWTSPWRLIQMDLRLQVMHLSTGLTTLMLSNVALGSVHDALVMQDLLSGIMPHTGMVLAGARHPLHWRRHGLAGPGMLRSIGSVGIMFLVLWVLAALLEDAGGGRTRHRSCYRASTSPAWRWRC